MIRLTLHFIDREIWVNPKLITSILFLADKETLITFDNKNEVTVRESPQEVLRKIKALDIANNL